MDAVDNNDSSIIITQLKQLVDEKRRYIANDIPFVNSNYKFLPETIESLESGKILLHYAIGHMDAALNRLRGVTCGIGKIVHQRLVTLLSQNPDYSTIHTINSILHRNDNDNSVLNLPANIKIENIEYYKYCLLVSVDAERSFSRYKAMLRDNRRGFLFENLSKHFFIMCNAD